MGFAVPVDTARTVVDTLIKDGVVVRPALGIVLVDPKQARTLGVAKGVLVLEVPPDGAAGKAGMKGTKRTEDGLVAVGDIIVGLGGYGVSKEADLFAALDKFRPGDEVDVDVCRQGLVEVEGEAGEGASARIGLKKKTLRVTLQSSDRMAQMGKIVLSVP